MRMDKKSAEPAGPGMNVVQSCRKVLCPGNTFVTCVRLVDGCVDEAWSTGRMMRNMNVLLQGKLDARGRPQFVQQAHCLCNDGHALAAVRALEDLAGVALPGDALLVRNLVQALRCVQEHLLHVYQFHLSDWVSLEAALRADPAKSARLARDPGQDTECFRNAQNRLRALAQDQGTDLFGGGMGAHPEYRGTDELHLLIHAHGLESLQTGGALHAALGLLGCGAEGFRAYRLGGLPQDMDLGADMRRQLRGLLERCRDFVDRCFLPDLERLAQVHAHWADRGAGHGFLSCSDYAHPGEDGPLYPGGVATPAGGARDGSGARDEAGNWAARPVRELIREEREPRWSPEDRDRYRLCLGPSGPAFHWGQGEFAWLPAPRHGQEACEVGSLARLVGAWAQGRDRVRRTMGDSLAACGLSPAALNSVVGRVLSRGLESAILARAALDWLDELESSPGRGRTSMRSDVSLPCSGLGTGRVEVPRGTLTHAIRLEKGRVVSHDYLIPSLWNFSPRDSHGGRGPLELALLGTQVADPDHPLEILRTVHALDPCNACKVVMEDTDTGRTIVVDAK